MKAKWFDVRCPWCKKINSRKGIEEHLYKPIDCYKCKKTFFINKDYETFGKRIYQNGEKACRNGLKIEDNPWKGTNHEYYAWKAGFINEMSSLSKRR